MMRTSASAFVRDLFVERPHSTDGGGARTTTAAARRAGMGGGGVGGGGSGGAGSGAAGGSGGGGGSADQRGKASQHVSVGAQFRDSMSALCATLGGTQSHFIRCIKPNAQRRAFALSPSIARAQLRCCGVLEAVRVSQVRGLFLCLDRTAGPQARSGPWQRLRFLRCPSPWIRPPQSPRRSCRSPNSERSPQPRQAGYPTRMPFFELIDRYALLLPNHVRIALSWVGGGGGRSASGRVVRRVARRREKSPAKEEMDKVRSAVDSAQTRRASRHGVAHA